MDGSNPFFLPGFHQSDRAWRRQFFPPTPGPADRAMSIPHHDRQSGACQRPGRRTPAASLLLQRAPTHSALWRAQSYTGDEIRRRSCTSAPVCSLSPVGQPADPARTNTRHTVLRRRTHHGQSPSSTLRPFSTATHPAAHA
jgi:hypothetical protein